MGELNSSDIKFAVASVFLEFFLITTTGLHRGDINYFFKVVLSCCPYIYSVYVIYLLYLLWDLLLSNYIREWSFSSLFHI